MKEKILTFIIGMLVGAIIATGGYYFYSKSNTKGLKGMPDGERPTMMQDGNKNDRGTPPEKPSDDENGPKGAQDKKDNSSKSQEDNTNTNNSENNV